MPWLRRFVNRWMTAQISRLTGVRLPDSQCGFRLVKLNAISQMTLRAKRFEAESELLVESLRAGLQVNFVPVQVIYGRGKSKIRPFRDSLRWLQWWLSQ